MNCRKKNNGNSIGISKLILIKVIKKKTIYVKMRKGGMKGISVKEQIEEVLKKKVKIKEEIFYDIADGLVKEFTNILMNQFPYE